MNFKFPNNFLWGSATSGPQTEGAADIDGKSQSVWDYWFAHDPQSFYNGIGPTDASTFYKNWKSDIAFLGKTGQNSFRTSIQWTRLIPDGLNVNPIAVEFYNNVIDELIANDITLVMNLYHFDMPMWAQSIGGWENRAVVDKFVYYAKTCFELFGDRVKFWATFNEPIGHVEGGYLEKYQYPLVSDGTRAAAVAYHTQLASSGAICEFKKMRDAGKLCEGAQIGIILNVSATYPKDSTCSDDVEAAEYCDLFFNKSYLEPAVYGVYPAKLIEVLKQNDAVPTHTSEDMSLIKNNTVDYLGVNYYQPRRAQARRTPYKLDYFMPNKYYENYQKPDAKMNKYRGWEIYESGIYDLAIRIKDQYNNVPFFISENGMGVADEENYIGHDGQVKDDYRIEFVKNHLKFVHKAMSEGANCFGYHMWTFIDCWSWSNAYKNRYGFVSLDLRTQKRTIKKFGQWFRQMTSVNGFD